MSLQIDEALREGFNRTIARSGLILVGVFLVFSIANAVVAQSFSQQMLEFAQQFSDQPIQSGQNAGQVPFAPGGGQQTPLAVPLPLPVLGLLSLVGAIVAEAIRIVAIRVFASDNTESVPGETVRRRIVLATLNGVVGGFVVYLLTAIGLVLLVVPGVYIALSFFFVRQEIAVADKNFIDALRDSWSLTAGNRWELLGLAVIVFVINLVASSPTIVLAFLDQTVATLLGLVIGSFTAVFGIAVATRAYAQLTDERAATGGDPDEGAASDWDDPASV
ncbi:hypothetical protein [Halorientalis litorea]|uniref:hypothetical protein n=1 Tax=Halorientalis litorea TaxID=2931977 RepID=UPI001FF6D848|nr:hypothetical protein [Halorientalis litorea]